MQPSQHKNYLTPYGNVRTYLTRFSTQKPIETFSARTKAFESFFFPYCAKKWVNLSEERRNRLNNMFKPSMFNFVKPRENSIFVVQDFNGLKVLRSRSPKYLCLKPFLF